MTTESGPLDLAALAELADCIGRVPRRELHCHRDVRLWLALTLPELEPQFPFTGSTGTLTGVPVIEREDFEPGTWEIREDGEVTANGHVEVPSWVTAPVDFKFSPFPRMTDRPGLNPGFRVMFPVPFSLSTIC